MIAGATHAAESDDAPDWANWRGPLGSGLAPDANPPISFSSTENVKWRTAIPGSGYSSPIVVGDRVYTMTCVETGLTVGDAPAEPERDEGRRGRRGRGPSSPRELLSFHVLALDKATGEILWNTKVTEAVPHESVHRTSSQCAGSPIVEGDRIYAFFGSRGLYAMTTEGEVLWSKDFGDMRIRGQFGEGATPALHGDTLVVPWDHEGSSFIVGLDAETGDERWRTPRAEPSNWSTPAIAIVNGRAQAIMPGSSNCIAYDVKTGEEIWRTQGLTNNVIPTPIVDNGVVYMMSGFRGSSLLAVDLSKAKGDISHSDAILWSHNRGTPYVPSAMLYGDNLYFLNSNSASLSCFNTSTGEANYVGQRMEALGDVYASIVGAGGHVYVCGREGLVAVIKDGPEFEVVKINSLGEPINATPAIVGDQMFLRTDTHMYCIAGSE
jgi:outer membrane protein assembly factor BamB